MKKFLTFFALLCALLGFSVPISAAVSLMGGSKTDWTTGITMTQVGTSNDYVCEVNNPGKYQYQIKDGDNWYGYGDSDASWAPSSFPANQTLTQGKKNFAIDSNGKFYVTFNTSTKKVTISPVLYLRGNAYSSWGTLESNKFSCVGNVYTLTMSDGISIGSGNNTGWRIDDGKDNYKFGKGANDPTVGSEGEAWFKSSANFGVSTDSYTTIQFTLVDGSAVQNSSICSKVKLTTISYPTLYIRGEQTKDNNGNAWSAVDDYKFTRKGNVYTLSIPGGISGTWEIADSNWSKEYSWGAPNNTTLTLSNGETTNLTWRNSLGNNDTGNLSCDTDGNAATVTFTYNATGTSTVKVEWAENDRPYIFIDGQCHEFTSETIDGTDYWVYNIGGSKTENKVFRLQTIKSTTSLVQTSTMPANSVLWCSTAGTPVEASLLQADAITSGMYGEIRTHQVGTNDENGTDLSRKWTVVSKNTSKLSFSKSNWEEYFEGVDSDMPPILALQTQTTLMKPDAPVLSDASGDKVTITVPAGETVRYSFTNEENYSTWTEYTSGSTITIPEGSSTIYAVGLWEDYSDESWMEVSDAVSSVASKTYTYTVGNPPYIYRYMDGGYKVIPFGHEGDNWVHYIDATSGDVQFRLQNDKNVTVSLLSNFNNGSYGSDATTNKKVLSGGDREISDSDTRTLYAYIDNGYDYKVKGGAEYMLSIPMSAATDFNECTLTITKFSDTPTIIRPSAKENYVIVKARPGYDLHYTIGGVEQTVATADVRLDIPTTGLTVTAWYTNTGETTAIGDIAEGTFAYYEAPQKWPIKKWTLSDNDYFPVGTYKYFYMSRFQNDDRVSPEWELIGEGTKDTDGNYTTYALRNFMAIPAGEFRIRRIHKTGDNSFVYNDFGLGSTSRLRLKDKFGVSGDNVALEKKLYTSSALSLSKDQSRGYAWDMGYTMASVVVTHTTGDNLSVTAIADFTQPSTFNGAPLPGMPVVTLTSSKLMIPTIEGQSVSVATKLDTSHPEYDTAFTNAWIQYDGDSNMLVYGDGIGDDTAVYYSASDHKPQAGQVMNSTILPPRNPVVFKLVDYEGNETRITSDKIILKYNEERSNNTRQLKTPDGTLTKSNAKFAVYELRDMEMAGLYKIYSGYGAHMYGGKDNGVQNGLSLFSNWGVGHQPSKEPYAGATIDSGQAYPLNGGGPKTDSNGYSWRDAQNDTNGCYGNEDNWAGRYFEFSQRTYVSKLNFFYALERDTEGNDGKGNWSKLDGNNWNLADDYYNSHHAQRTNDGKDEYYNSKDDTNSPHWDQPNYTNDGVNFSWFNMTYDGSIGRVILSKVGANTGRVLYSINNFVAHPGNDALHAYNVHLIKIDPKTGEPITGDGAYDKLVGSGDLNGATELEDQVATEADLTTGWYVARFIFHSDTHDEDTGAAITNQKNELYSTRIFVFGIEGAKIEALQRTSEDADGLKLYHPVIDVKPDATEAIAGLVDDSAEGSGVDKSMVYGYVEIASISTTADVTKIVDTDGNALPESAAAAGAGKMYVTYDAANGKATVHYPQGFFSSAAPDMDFAVMNAAIGRYTDFKLTITADNAVKPATDEVSALVSMPAAKLDGQIVAEKREGGVKFNALRLADSADPTCLSGVISYVDAKGQPCGVAEVDDTQILAHVLYGEYDPTDESGYIELTVGQKEDSQPTDMKELVGGVKRYAVGAIPYETDEADGVKIRKNQTVPFTVNLDYLVEGYAAAAVNGDCNKLTYAATNLTAPRDRLTDLNKDNYNNRGNYGVATDVTAVTESYVEKYGGLFTNIEDAHVALQAVPKNEDLVGDNSFDKWYMDHGDKWDDATASESTNPRNVNPFNPADHRAVGNTKRDGSAAYATVNEVHPLLITGSSSIVSSANDFQDGTGSVNNAWWNTNARVKPEFHTADHINGDFVRDANGKVTGWSTTSTINHPRQHREWWAGVNAGNDDKYNVFDGSSVLTVQDQSVDIRDPKHGYYDNSSHFTTEPGIRTAYHLGEIPLNANDVLALYGTSDDRRNEIATYLGTFDALKSVALPFHNNMDQAISEAVTAEGFTGSTTINIDGSPYTINISPSTPWILDDLWKIRQTLAFKPTVTVGQQTGKSPAEQLFTAANNHMIFKVNHVNHESWWVPGAYHQIIQHDIKTRPIWGAFKGVKDADGKTIDSYSSDAEKEAFVMKHLRMKLDDYCPLAYDVRYTYPFLTSKDYIAGEAVTSTTYAQSRINKAPAKQTEIEEALNAVVESAVTPVAAPSKGRVPFFDATTVGADEYVPTVLNDVSDDIRGNGFSIVYNRVAGTVTVTAEGERELKDAAVYDISGSSMVLGATADRINDRTIVLDVRGIAQGAYIVSTNLGGAKFMK